MSKGQSITLQADRSTCDDSKTCPDHLPYFTPAGCVFKCPEGVFVNGTTCVKDCGDDYILNKACVNSCPENYTLVEEQIDSRFKTLRFCRSQCELNTFAYNSTCLKACPSSSKYAEDGLCILKCSAMKPLHQNIIIDNRLVAIECLYACNKTSRYPFQYLNECVTKCNDSQVVSAGNCLQSCPNDAHILVNLKTCQQLGTCPSGWPDQSYCSNKCPQSSYIYNNRCVDKCPETARLSFKGQCVNRCPDQQYICYKHNDIRGLSEAIECCKECPYPLRSNNYTSECVAVCPDELKHFNRICLMNCPHETFIRRVKDSDELQCVSNCKQYIINDQCVDFCPEDVKYINGSHCVTECPESHSYTAENPPRCFKVCPEYLKTNSVTKECIERCPKDTFTYKKSCLSDCPTNTFKEKRHMECVESCNNFDFNGTCVDSCRKYSINRSCVDECPAYFKAAYGGVCLQECPNNTCVSSDGFNCTENCVRSMKDSKLLNKCPESAPYTRMYMSEINCVPICQTYEVLKDLACINVTECDRAVLSHGKCSNECPHGYLYIPNEDSKFVKPANGYHYTYEDADDEPCKSRFLVYLNLVCAWGTLLLVIYAYVHFLFGKAFSLHTCEQRIQEHKNEVVLFSIIALF